MKKLVLIISRNGYAHIFLGLCVVLTGFWELGDTILDDIIRGQIRGGHGIIILGVCHMFKAIADVIEASDYLEEGLHL